MTIVQILSACRVPGATLLSLLACLALSPEPFAEAQSDDGDIRHPLVTVQTRDGQRVTLRDARLGVKRGGERPAGSKPPGTPVGPLPGNTPGVGGFGGPGDPGSPTKPDPRQPTHNLGGTPRRPGRALRRGLTVREMYLLRRVYILQEVEGKPVPEGVTYGDFYYKNGEIRHNVPMTWTTLSGWERPGQQGNFHFFDARDILYLEFPEY